MTSHLFTPFTLRGVTFRNRIWVPPMCMYSAFGEDGIATDWHLMHYGRLAAGGAGAIIVEATSVVPEGRISARDLGLWSDDHVEPLRRVTTFVHTQNTHIGVQLAHAGRKASTYAMWGAPGSGALTPEHGAWPTVAPSELAFHDYPMPRALTAEEIDGIAQAFVASAGRAVAAGFDFIEIHAAHGYLLHEFLSPLSNARTDTYGGSLKNRARLLFDVVRGIRATIPETMPLFVRVSATDWLDGGLTGEDLAQVATWLRDLGVDLIDVSTGGLLNASIPAEPNYQVPFARLIRETANIPTAAVGLITEPEQAEKVLADGSADAVLIGRAALRNPNWPSEAAVAMQDGASTIAGQAHRGFPRIR